MPTPCDNDIADVALLLHCDGSNGSTSFPDSSPNNFTVTPNNGAAVTTSNPEFGTGSLALPGTAYLSVPVLANGPMDYGASDFTIECWVLFTTSNFSGAIAGDESSGGGSGIKSFISATGSGSDVTFTGTYSTTTGNHSATTSPIPAVQNTWYSIALVWQSSIGQLTMFANGVGVSNSPILGTKIGSGGAYRIGQCVFPSGTDASIIGQLDEFRLTNGVARYTANYTPSGPFGDISCSLTVPNVTGQALATAETNLTAVGLVIGTVTQTSDPVINSGNVILTAPSAGASAMVGDTVDITESNSETVPNVNGELLSTGESDLTSAGFVVGTVSQTSDPIIDSGFIISTSPAGGTRATAGSTVNITESNSETVPNVVGVPLASAETDITNAGLTVGTITTQFSLTVPGGNIISSTPVGGTRVTAGSSVALLESSGPGVGTVPDVLNTSAALAEASIVAAGFVVGTVSFQSDAIIISGNVDLQSPAGGTSAFLASPVNITISTGLPTLRVPDLFGLTQSAAIILLLSLGLVPGAIGSAPSQFVPPGEVQAQNPSAGAPVAAGTIVSFVTSLGTPAVGTIFDFEATVISQYANSPTILQLCNNLNQYIDQSANFANFYNFVWNVDTAVGFGLDIWGKIVGVSRLLQIPNSTEYVGFYIKTESQPDQDWTPAGSDQPPYNKPPVGGAFYTGHNATEAYLLDDDAYRQLILAKAFANICTTTAPAINQILQNLYGPGTAFVLNTGPMAISYNLTFTPTAIQLAILEQSGVIPTPPAVSVVINTDV